MHAYGRFIQQQLDARGWSAADLSRRTGITQSGLTKILQDPDDRPGMPTDETVNKLADAFGIPPGVIIAQAASARYGVPVGEPVELASASTLSDDELIQQMAIRLRERERSGSVPGLDLSDMSPEARIQIDGLAQSLAEDAEASEQRGNADLAKVQRQLAASIDAAIAAAAATRDRRRRRRPQNAEPSSPTSH